MEDKTISVTRLARNLADIINRVAYRGERFLVIRGSRPVAELVPAPTGRRLGDLPAVLDRLPRLGSDDADALDRDLGEARRSLAAPESPWAS